MTHTRADLHRPSVIKPEDYIEVGFLPQATGFGDSAFRLAEIERINAHMKQTGGRYSYPSRGSCDVCGNVQAMTHVVFYHQPSNEYIKVGEICAQKMDLAYDSNGVSLFKNNLKEEAALRAGKRKAEATLTDAGLSEAWAIWTEYRMKPMNEVSKFRLILIDLVDKLIRYGSLSEKQMAFARKIVEEIIPNEGIRAAARAAEQVERAAKSQHVGQIGARLTVTASVVFTKYIDTGIGQYGRYANSGYTITSLRDEAGNEYVWMGTGFGVDRGAVITFKGTVKDHSEYNGVKQTKLTRCKLITVDKEAPEQSNARHGQPGRFPSTSGAFHPDPEPVRKDYWVDDAGRARTDVEVGVS